MRQIPDGPILSNRYLAEGQRTELAMNVRTQDGMTNGARYLVKKAQLYQEDKPHGIIWVMLDHADVGEKLDMTTDSCMCAFGETTGISEIFRSLKRMHFVPIIDDVFIRGFKKCSVACCSVE